MNKKRLAGFFILLLLFSTIVYAQQVAINNSGALPNPRSILDIKSNDKGVLLPRLTTSQRLGITVQPSDAGLIVFDTDKQIFYFFNGGVWVPLLGGSEKNVSPVNYSVSDALPDDHLGESVAIEGDYAVVGAFGADIAGNSNQGAAYVFTRTETGWIEHSKLLANDGGESNLFGYSVAISGDYMVIGSMGADINGHNSQGAAYVFKRNGNIWEQQAKLVSADGATEDFFGKKVVIENNVIVVGAPGDDFPGNNSQGSIYVFTRSGSTWSQTAKLFANDGGPGDEFGFAIDKYGDYIAVGAPYKKVGANFYQGAVYVFNLFNNSIWLQQQKIFNSLGHGEDFFGSAVGIYNGVLAIGIPGSDGSVLQDVGYVAVYRFGFNNTWDFQTSLFINEGADYDQFGTTLDMNANKIIVGADYHSVNGYHEGIAAVYQRSESSWGFQRKISDVEPQPAQRFGHACAIDRLSNRYAIGSVNKNNYSGIVSFGITE